MTCREKRLQISEYLDGAMTPSESAQLLSHVETCGACRNFLEEQQTIAEHLQGAEWELQPPPQLWQRIEARIAPVAAAGSDRTFWGTWLTPQSWGYALAASLALAILSGGLFLGRQPLNQHLLAQLNAYQVEVPENPFLVQPGADNPFFEPFEEFEGNPFDTRSPK